MATLHSTGLVFAVVAPDVELDLESIYSHTKIAHTAKPN